MNGNSVALRYAEAFFELVKSQGRLEDASQDLGRVAGLIGRHLELRRFLANPDVEPTEKLSVLDRLMDGDWTEEVRVFVQMVLDMGRAEALAEIAEAFGALVDDAHGIARVRVRTARPLTGALKASLTRKLEQLGHKQVEMVEEADPALLGGIQVFIGNRVFDGSLRTKLGELRQRLKSVRVH